MLTDRLQELERLLMTKRTSVETERMWRALASLQSSAAALDIVSREGHVGTTHARLRELRAEASDVMNDMIDLAAGLPAR